MYLVCDRHLITKPGLHMNVEGKEVMIRKLLDLLPTILDRYKASKLIPLIWKNNHSILLSKLQFYGVNGKAKSWFESYLHNRYKRVQILDEGLNQTSFSAWEKITDGVPQGIMICPKP